MNAKAKRLVRNIRRAEESLTKMKEELHQLRLKCEHKSVIEKGYTYTCENCLAPLVPVNETKRGILT